MATVFDNLAAIVASEGPRRHARWDRACFEELVVGPAQALWQSLDEQPKAEPVLAAYFQLLREGVGAGYLRRSDGNSAVQWPNFLSFCLVQLVPASLANVAVKDRLPLLAQVWNIGEGLLREPAWVDRFVLACAGNLTEATDIQEFLVQTLEPALMPTREASWTGPFALSVLDARQVDDDFLPGEMHLAAPAVLCVHDRRRSDIRLGLFLQHGQQSRFLGLTSCLGECAAGENLPAVKILENQAQIAGKSVDLPLLHSCWKHTVAAAGFTIVSALDSQRLWIVESL